MSRKRKRGGRSRLQKRKSRKDGSTPLSRYATQSEIVSPGERLPELPEESRGERQGPSVGIAQTLQAASVVPVVPLLLPEEIGTDAHDSDPLLNRSDNKLGAKIFGLLRGIFGLDFEDEESELNEETREDAEYSEVLTQLNELYDQLLRRPSEEKKVDLEEQIEKLQKRRVELKETHYPIIT
ncbi:MAG: hypothetical protein WD187_00660 [Candidatus Woykebacteria bacterium]